MNKIYLIIIISMSLIACNSVSETFKKELDANFENATLDNTILTQSDISGLPYPVQKYFKNCGFLNKPVIQNAEVIWDETYIKLSPQKDWLKLKTVQYNSVKQPFRIVYMHTNLLGFIPFEGRDIYSKGEGHMYGKLGKIINIFYTGEREVGQSALITILAESLFIPGYALQDYITWESIDEYTAKASIQDNGFDVSGIFHFNQDYEMTLFESEDRYYMNNKSFEKRKFSARTSDYITVDGYKFPSYLVASWELETGKYDYWKGIIKKVNFNINLKKK